MLGECSTTELVVELVVEPVHIFEVLELQKNCEESRELTYTPSATFS